MVELFGLGIAEGGEFGEEVTEVAEGFDAEVFAGGGEGEEDRGGAAALVGTGEHPVFATDGDESKGPFGEIVVDAQEAGRGVSRQGVEIGEGVLDRQPDWALGQ